MPKNDIIALADLEITEAPFPHFSSKRVFKKGLEKEIYQWFENTDAWHFSKTSFYTQYELSLLNVMLPPNLHCLISSTTITKIADLVQNAFKTGPLNVVGITAHKLLGGYKMGVHNDFIGKVESHRVIVQINPGWTQQNGGFLMMFNSSDPKDVSKIIQPLNNSAIGFEISEKSYHAVSTVYNYSRHTLVYTYNLML